MTEPKYKPILFTAPMVMAILEGRKTQTRRLNGLDDVNKIPDAWDAARVTVGALNYKVKKSAKGKYGATFISHPGAIVNNTINVCPQICPYGQPGDRLWVRETWGVGSRPDPLGGYEGIEYRADEFYLEDSDDLPCLRVTPPPDVCLLDYSSGWRSSRFMPRWASRITLEVTGVRVERLGEISEDDSLAEGVGSVAEYIELWKTINKTWETEKWIWVLQFQRV